jgi:hypothetical protein
VTLDALEALVWFGELLGKDAVQLVDQRVRAVGKLHDESLEKIGATQSMFGLSDPYEE